MCVFSSFLCFFLLLPLNSARADSQPSDPPIERHTINIGKLRKAIQRHQEKVSETGRKEKTILEEIESVDARIEEQRKKIALIEQQIQEQEALIAAKEREIETINQEKEALQQHLIQRLTSYYYMGKINLLNVTFSQENLPDLMVFNDAFRSLVTYDREVFNAYRQKKSAVQQAKQAHELEKTVKLSFLHQSEEEKKALDFIAEEKNTLLHKTKNQKNLYAQALTEMRKAEGDLTSTILELKEKQEKKSKGFLNSKGTLPPPVAGSLLSPFQQGKEQDSPLSNGITVTTDDGTKVHAIYEGKVIYAGYMRGFGKTVIIDHGHLYYTVTARLDALMIEKGDAVNAGQLIGTTGNIATLFGRGLYFEIRHGSTPMDPLAWLKPGAYGQ